ncbi:hypothetical protein [Paraferrimonas sp. SM1919]|uniref:hypothetical protein n=1 Tax=Paraferrimonas sp. SM1919 TaxID=2662263 RepID=UPI0013D19D39|nr:hypothetical protein [Paraferrimonas sp. SM1919]
MIVGFSGIDGCGKSTYIKMIKKEYEVNILWTRIGYTPGMDKLKALARAILGKKLPKPGRSDVRTKGLKNPFVQRVWITLALIELFWIFIIKARIKSFNKILLLDRQLCDSIIDLKVLFGSEILQDPMYKAFIFIIGKLSPKIFKVGIFIDYETSIYRCKNKFEPFPDTDEEKQIRVNFYNEKQVINDFELLLDGNKSIEENFKLIKEKSNL